MSTPKSSWLNWFLILVAAAALALVAIGAYVNLLLFYWTQFPTVH